MWGLDALDDGRTRENGLSLAYISGSADDAKGEERVVGEVVSERDCDRTSDDSEVTFELDGVLVRNLERDNLSRKLVCCGVNARDVDDMEACARALTSTHNHY